MYLQLAIIFNEMIKCVCVLGGRGEGGGIDWFVRRYFTVRFKASTLWPLFCVIPGINIS